jgi:hypothetical protein
MLAQGIPPPLDPLGVLWANLFTLILGAIGFVTLVLACLSLWWTTHHERGILRRALGRKVRAEDESSLKTWMNLRGDQLADAQRELARNPFDGPLDALDTLGDRLSEVATTNTPGGRRSPPPE